MRKIIILLFTMLFVTSCGQTEKSVSKGEAKAVKVKAKAVEKKQTYVGFMASERPKIFAAIKAKAAKDHPSDYITQNYIINQQSKSYIDAFGFPWEAKISEDVSGDIFAKAYRDHGKGHDYITMLYVLKSQLSAYTKLN